MDRLSPGRRYRNPVPRMPPPGDVGATGPGKTGPGDPTRRRGRSSAFAFMMPDTDIQREQGLFQNRPFLLLWIAQAITQTAQNGIFFVLMVFIAEATGSTTHMSLLVFSTI